MDCVDFESKGIAATGDKVHQNPGPVPKRQLSDEGLNSGAEAAKANTEFHVLRTQP